MRRYSLNRKTKETNINVEVNIDGTGRSEINTGINFWIICLINFQNTA